MGKEHEVISVKKAGHLNSKLRKLVQNPKKTLRNYVKPGMRVLDFGCGPGVFAIAMAELKADVIAADLQQGMLDLLKENISDTKYEKSIHPIKCKEDEINVKGPVDFIFAFYVINQVKDKEKMFGQLNKILKDKEKMFIAEPKFHISRNEFEEELEAAEKQGFKIIKRPRFWLSRVAVLEKQ